MTGTELRELRRRLGLSQRLMALLLGLRSPDTVYRKEKGLRRVTQRDLEILEAKGLVEKGRYGLL